VVNGVTPGSPAAQAGIRVGDRISAVDGKPYADVEALSRTVEDAQVGKEFTITVERNGARREIKIQTRLRPELAVGAGGPLPPTPFGPIRRFRPRDRALGPVDRRAPRRAPEILKSEPERAEPAAQPYPDGSKPKGDDKKAGKSEQTPKASADQTPKLPPALAPNGTGPSLDNPDPTSL
jgi:membrane-associated protease RseP (regulator of RpoE activity)